MYGIIYYDTLSAQWEYFVVDICPVCETEWDSLMIIAIAGRFFNQ